jgi:hypothetical protein
MVDFAKYLNRNMPRSESPMAKSNPFGAPREEDDDSFEVQLPSDEEEASKWVVPEGEYDARVVGLEKEESNAGNPMYVWEFELLGPGELKGRTFKSWTALTPAAMWKVREVLEALGLGESGKKAKFTKKDAIGRRCTLDIQDDEYEGKLRSTVKTVLPPQERVSTGGDPLPVS